MFPVLHHLFFLVKLPLFALRVFMFQLLNHLFELVKQPFFVQQVFMFRVLPCLQIYLIFCSF